MFKLLITAFLLFLVMVYLQNRYSTQLDIIKAKSDELHITDKLIEAAPTKEEYDSAIQKLREFTKKIHDEIQAQSSTN